jgi:DNA-binding response OmpR family regulator
VEPPAVHANRRVLVVEDDATTRLSLALLLHRAGYAVASCADGEAACAQLAATPYDLLLVDLVLADAVDGLAVVTCAARLADPPAIVVLTGFGSQASLAAATALGVTTYLLKPCLPHTLLAALAAAVRRDAPASPLVTAHGDPPQ